MKGKSIIVSILTALVMIIGSYSGLLPASIQPWLGIVSAALVLTLSTFFPSGVIVSGWNWVMWGTNVAAVLVQVLNLISEDGLVSASIINGVIVGINIIIQVFFKNYDDPAK